MKSSRDKRMPVGLGVVHEEERNPRPEVRVVRKRSPLPFFFLILMIFGLFAVTLYYYNKSTQLERQITRVSDHPAQVEDPMTATLLNTGRHMMLPQGEMPQIARVSDLAPLANVPFFANALVGDEVLVYCKASLSVLYSPARDKVIEVSRTPVTGSCK